MLIGLAACSVNPAPTLAVEISSIPTATRPPQPLATVAATLPPTSQPTAIPSPPASFTPTRPALSLSNPRLVVLAENLPGPDDLVLAPDGTIYLSDVNDGTIKRYTAGGQLQVILSGLNEPEGMVVLPDGSLLIAEQGKNRLVRFDFKDKRLSPFLKLTNKTRNAGVDGIALDARTPDSVTVIIPDSPNGNVLRASLDGKTVGEVGKGFARPTAAWVEADGGLLVVDENAGTLTRIRPDGSLEKLADLPVPDDVIEDAAGNIFVNTLRDSAIHLIPAGTKQDTILMSGLGGPQGLIFDAQGDLVVTDPGHHRLVKIVIH